MKKFLLFVSLVVLITACSKGPKFEVSGTVDNENLHNNSFVVEQNSYGEIVFIDSTKIKKDKFSLKIPFAEPLVMYGEFPGTDIPRFMFMTESEGILNVQVKGDKAIISGTPLNDKHVEFQEKISSFDKLSTELVDKYFGENATEESLDERKEKYMAESASLEKERMDYLYNFIKENIDNPLGEYYFMITYPFAGKEEREILNSFAPKKLVESMNLKPSVQNQEAGNAE